MTYALTSEGLWGAALMFFNVLFAGLIAFNFYEPLAALIDRHGHRLGLLRHALPDAASSSSRRAPPADDRDARAGDGPVPGAGLSRRAGSSSAWPRPLVTMAILLLAFHTAPVHKKIFGVIDYKYKPPFGLGLDHKWLGFFQYTPGLIFARPQPGHRPTRLREYGTAKVFDPKAEWLLRHQDARPYGKRPCSRPRSRAKGPRKGRHLGGTARRRPTERRQRPGRTRVVRETPRSSGRVPGAES